jgi:hypothetical protein
MFAHGQSAREFGLVSEDPPSSGGMAPTLGSVIFLIDEQRIELDDTTLDELIDRLRRAGTPVRNKQMEVVYETPSYELGHRLSDLDRAGEFRPTEAEAVVLEAHVRHWVSEYGLGEVPHPVERLFDELRLRRRSDLSA